MHVLRSLTIAFKIYAVVALLAVLALGMGWVGQAGMRTYGVKGAEMRDSSERAMMGERVTGLINAAVMHSRGIYMATDQAGVRKFGEPLLASLDAMAGTLDTWRALLPAARRAEIDEAARRIHSFVDMRREVVRLAEAGDLAGARTYGDNDANRLDRLALYHEIEALSAANGRETVRLQEDLDRFYRGRVTLMAGLGLAALAVIGLAVLIVRRSVVRPIQVLTEAMQRLARHGQHRDRDRPPESSSPAMLTLPPARWRRSCRSRA